MGCVMSSEHQPCHYSIDWQGASPKVIFRRLSDDLSDICRHSLHPIKTHLYAIELISEDQRRRNTEPIDLFGLINISPTSIEKFLCAIRFKQGLIAPEVAIELESTIAKELKNELKDTFIPRPVFIKKNSPGPVTVLPPTSSSPNPVQDIESLKHLIERPVYKKIRTFWQDHRCIIAMVSIGTVFCGILTVVLVLTRPEATHELQTPETTPEVTPESLLNQDNVTTSPRILTPNASHIIAKWSTSKKTTSVRPILFHSPVTEKPYNFSNIFEKPDGFTVLVEDMESIRYSQTMICRNTMVHTTLNISLTKRVDIEGFNPDCPENIKGLDISGPFSISDVIKLLQRFINLEYLSFSGHNICQEMEDNSLEFNSPREKITLPHLTFLKFENLTECPVIYNYFAESVQTPVLVTLVLSQIFMNYINQGYLCDQCDPFKMLRSWPSLTHLELHVTNPSGPKAMELNKILLTASPDLEYFKSNIPLKERNIKLLKTAQLNLIYIDTVVQFNDSRLHFSVKSFKDFPNLRQLHFKLEFSDQSVCKTQNVSVLLKSLKLLVTKLPSIDNITFASSNCRIQASNGEWRLPCRDHNFEVDEVLKMRIVSLPRSAICTTSKG